MPPRSNPPTLREVARAAKLSPAAVSMALSHHPNIPLRTRHRVELAAARLGYKRNFRISEVMAYVRNSRHETYRETIGYLSSHPRDAIPGWQLPYLLGATQEAARLHCGLDFHWCEEPGLSNRRLSDILRRRGIRGVVIAPLLDGKRELDLEWERFAAVSLTYYIVRPELHRVLNHHYHTVLLAMEQLVDRGYRRIALALRPINQWGVNHLWKAGYLSGLEIHGLDAEPLCFIQAFDAAAFHRWFLRQRPDAIIANDVTYYEALRRSGFNAPEDFGIVSLTVREEAERELSRVDQNHIEQGAAAVRLLVSELIHNQIGIPAMRQTVMLESSWVEGETVRAVSDAARSALGRTPRSAP